MKIIQMRNISNTQGLLDLALEFPKDTIMAEIGSYAGESTELFLSSGRVKQIFAIDPWRGGYDPEEAAEVSDFALVEAAFEERMRGKNVVKLKMTMGEAFDLLPELDVVYIDGNHTYACILEDIRLSLQKVKSGGIVCGHDYDDKGNDVIRAVNEVFGKPDKIFSDASWMVKIKQ